MARARALGVVGGAGLLFVARVRDWLRPTRRVGGILAAVAVAVTGLVLVIPDGWLPLPPGPGIVTPGYVGRPAVARPVAAAAAAGPGHGAGAPWAGPLGESPPGRHRVVRPRAVRGPGVRRARPAGRAVRQVAGAAGHRPRLDAVAGRQGPPRPARGDGTEAWEELCGRASYLDDEDRAVVATTDRRVLVVATDDAEGDPDLTTAASHDLSGQVPADDCLVALRPDGRGGHWFASRHGRVGTIDAGTGGPRCWTSARTSPTRSPSTATACTS